MEGLIPKDELFKIISSYEAKFQYCQTSDLGLRLEVDFVFPLSQEEQQQEEEEPLTKIYRME